MKHQTFSVHTQYLYQNNNKLLKFKCNTLSSVHFRLKALIKSQKCFATNASQKRSTNRVNNFLSVKDNSGFAFRSSAPANCFNLSPEALKTAQNQILKGTPPLFLVAFLIKTLRKGVAIITPGYSLSFVDFVDYKSAK